MIRYLAIRNLAVIESVAVDFEQSFNILTGETGAGKSILVEAVGLLLGGRATQDLIRTGEDLATVEAIFETEDGSELIVRREITSQGRSRAFINGALATAAALKDLSNRLVELHGQHEHQQLLDPTQHLALLDAWAGLDAARADVAAAFANVRGLREQLDRLRMDDRERAARLDLVEFQLGELQKANLQHGRGRDARRRAAAAAQRRHHPAPLRRKLRGAVRLRGVRRSSILGRIWKRVSELAAIDPRFAPYLEARDGIKAQLDDLAFTLRDFADGIDASPERLQQVEDRLALIERLKRKHGGTLEEAIAHRDRLAAEHQALTGGQSTVAEIEQQLADAGRTFLAAARRLSAQPPRRRAEVRAAGRSRARRPGDGAHQVRGAADDVGSGRAVDRRRHRQRRAVPVAERRRGPPAAGQDRFGRRAVACHAGAEDHRRDERRRGDRTSGRLAKTLIFDEVDAGIGGRVATVVGQKLASLGDRFQVLCITHLPQIAACGRSHFLIEKRVQGGRTVTSVSRLDGEERVAEIARMMGGSAAGEKALESARELLDTERRRKAKAKGESRHRRRRKRRHQGHSRPQDLKTSK